MTVELRPLGVTCNLACHYCYQNPQRDAGNARATYDLEKMKAAAARIGGPFTLFGGEPLMMRLPDLEHLFAWGLETHGQNAIQTNGVLIESAHIDLFRRYKVSVGVSIDGPGALNDARWHRGLAKTRRSTERVRQAIERLCREHEAPGLIVTLHKGNATRDKFPTMFDWLRGLDAMGIKSVRLHLLEVDHQTVHDSLALSAGENIAALCAFAEFERSLTGMRFDLFREMEQLLAGQDAGASCTWRACDPYTTDAVQGVEGDGQTSNCGRTNKDGIGFIKADVAGYERYLALFRTLQSQNGCAGCRFFLMCKGQCPGTAVDGDWRNRTEHCAEWMHLFSTIERRMIVSGKIPLTIQPLRFDIERRQLEHWARGENPSMSWIASTLRKERAGGRGEPIAPASAREPKPRISWVSDAARDLWQPRVARIQAMLEDMTVHAARDLASGAAARLMPRDSIPRLQGLAAGFGLTCEVFPADALPRGVCARPGEDQPVTFAAGGKDAVERMRDAVARGDRADLLSALNLPICCARCANLPHPGRAAIAAISTMAAGDGTELVLPASLSAHPLLAPMGLWVLPILPCAPDCARAADSAERWLRRARDHGYDEEVEWLRTCLSWAMVWSELHGVIEIKTPVFKQTLLASADVDKRQIRRLGPDRIDGAVTGLNFPFAAPALPGREGRSRLSS
jgi:uncharacterized protein